MLGIPTVTDRMFQQAIAQVLMPFLTLSFPNIVMDFAQKEGDMTQLGKQEEYIKEGYRYVVDLDLKDLATLI